jgi:flagellar hook-associated protein 3 FlgL
MRITNAHLSHLVKEQLSTANERLGRLQTEISSGVRLQTPSDDPAATTQVAVYRTRLARVAQYQATVTTATAWAKQEESTLGSMTDSLRSAKTLALQGNTATATAASREALATQVESLRGTLLSAANAKLGDRALFGGYQTAGTPFSTVNGAVTYSGDAGTMSVAIGDGLTVPLNTNGAQVLNMGGAANAGLPDVFATLDGLAAALRSGDSTALQASMDDLDAHMTRLTGLRGQTGIRLQQLEMTDNRLSASAETLEGLVTDTEGTDLTSAIVELKEQQNVLQAAGYVTATLSNGGLLQWLR